MCGQRFKIKSPTVGLERPEQHTHLLHIPAGSSVKVVSEPSGADRVVSVDWNGRAIVMFARDLVERGEPIPTDE